MKDLDKPSSPDNGNGDPEQLAPIIKVGFQDYVALKNSIDFSTDHEFSLPWMIGRLWSKPIYETLVDHADDGYRLLSAWGIRKRLLAPFTTSAVEALNGEYFLVISVNI